MYIKTYLTVGILAFLLLLLAVVSVIFIEMFAKIKWATLCIAIPLKWWKENANAGAAASLLTA